MTAQRIGLIGAGYWGPNLARNFEEMATTELVAVADMNQERLQRLTSRYPKIQTVSSHEDLFKLNLDAVVIATPPATHFPIALDCLNHGLHVLVEKPLALNSEHVKVLIHTAEERGLVLMVGHTFEYNIAVQTMRRMIESGELGDIYYIDMVRTNLGLFQKDINVLWDLAPHDLSILLYLLGKYPTSVTAEGGSYVLKHLNIHDLVYAHYTFPSGLIASVRVSWLDPNKTRKVTIVGSKKMLVYDDVGLEKLKVYDKGVDIHPDTDNYGNFQCHYRYGDVVTPHIVWEEPLRVECEHFTNCIINHQHPLSDGYSGLRVVELLEATDWSLQNHGVPKDLEHNPSLSATLKHVS